jgi:hypothetical protein
MTIRNKRITVPAMIILAIASGAVAQRTSAPAAVPSKAQSSPKLVFFDILEALVSYPDPHRVESLVRVRGVDFVASPSDIDVLREHGATEALLDLIPKKSVPAPLAPKTAGELTVTCEPVDCEVIVNDHYYGITEGAVKHISALAPGNARIDIMANGFENLWQGVVLEEGKPQPVKFLLVRAKSQQQADINDLVLRIIKSLGGVGAMADLQRQSVTGKVKKGDKSAAFRIDPAARGYSLSVDSAGGGPCDFSFSADSPGATLVKKCKGAKDNTTQDLASSVADLYRAAELAHILNDLLSTGFNVTSDADGTHSLQSATCCALKIDKDARPIDAVRSTNDSEPMEDIHFEFDGRQYPTKTIVTRRVGKDRTIVADAATFIAEASSAPRGSQSK